MVWLARRCHEVPAGSNCGEVVAHGRQRSYVNRRCHKGGGGGGGAGGIAPEKEKPLACMRGHLLPGVPLDPGTMKKKLHCDLPGE